MAKYSYKVAVVGEPKSGKSTLLAALAAGEDFALPAKYQHTNKVQKSKHRMTFEHSKDIELQLRDTVGGESAAKAYKDANAVLLTIPIDQQFADKKAVGEFLKTQLPSKLPENCLVFVAITKSDLASYSEISRLKLSLAGDYNINGNRITLADEQLLTADVTNPDQLANTFSLIGLNCRQAASAVKLSKATPARRLSIAEATNTYREGGKGRELILKWQATVLKASEIDLQRMQTNNSLEYEALTEELGKAYNSVGQMAMDMARFRNSLPDVMQDNFMQQSVVTVPISKNELLAQTPAHLAHTEILNYAVSLHDIKAKKPEFQHSASQWVAQGMRLTAALASKDSNLANQCSKSIKTAIQDLNSGATGHNFAAAEQVIMLRQMDAVKLSTHGKLRASVGKTSREKALDSQWKALKQDYQSGFAATHPGLNAAPSQGKAPQ